jgi:replicative DNA helicase
MSSITEAEAFGRGSDSAIESLRLPPHSVEAEQALIGGVILHNAAFDRVQDIVTESDFYRADHRVLWHAVAKLIDSGKPADTLTVAHALKSSGEDRAMGLPYLHEIVTSTPGAANIRQYAAIVRDHAQRRRLIDAAVQIEDMAYSRQGEPVAELNNRAQSLVMEATAEHQRSDARGMAAVLTKVMESLDAKHRGEDTKFATGLKDLDRQLLGGLRPRKLYVIAGRPSSGKSVLGLQIAKHGATKGIPAGIASMEMDDEENGERLLASEAMVPLDAIVRGDVVPEDWERLGAALGKLNAVPLYIDDTPALTLNQLRSRARAMKVKHGIRILVVDYLQLTKADTKGERRDIEVGDVAKGLKDLAKELDLAVVALAQMNRKCEERPNKRGVMADLENSGAIEQAADVIVFVYRDEMYSDDSPDVGTAELIFRKARQAKVGTVRVVFRGEFSRFEDLAHEWKPRVPVSPQQPEGRKRAKGFAGKDD